jgi:signal transduction histidine kinase
VPDSAESASTFALDREALDRLYPFHVRVDSAFRIVGAGRSLVRLLPLYEAAPLLDSVFAFERPAGVTDFASLIAAQGQAVLLGSRLRPNLELKGEVFAPPGTDQAVLLIVPWVRDTGVIEEFNLTVSDFAIGDSTPDHLFLIETQAALLQDAREMTERLKAARDEAVLASRTKTEFLANMSHELRTPLNAIIGFSEYLTVLGGKAIPERFLGYVKDIHDSGHGLLAFVDDLLELSRLDMGKVVVAETEFDLVTLVAEVSRAVSSQASAASVRIALSSPRSPLLLRADERMLRQVLINVLTNAIKFNRAGGSIEVRLENVGTAGIELAVIDTGVGVEPALIPELFQPFRSNAQVTRAHGGTGLGLSIVKRLVELHEGEVFMKSAPGAGTTVTVRLPAARLIDEAPAVPAAIPARR